MVSRTRRTIIEISKKPTKLIFQGLTSIPGVGPVYAAGLIAEIGQIERFENQAKLGLHWKKSESGNNKSENTPLTKRGIGIFAIT